MHSTEITTLAEEMADCLRRIAAGEQDLQARASYLAFEYRTLTRRTGAGLTLSFAGEASETLAGIINGMNGYGVRLTRDDDHAQLEAFVGGWNRDFDPERLSVSMPMTTFMEIVAEARLDTQA